MPPTDIPTTDWVRLLSDWLQFGIAGACGAGLALWASLGRRDRSLSAHINALAAAIEPRLQNKDQRLTRLESQAPHLPTTSSCSTHLERLGRLEEQMRGALKPGDLAPIYDVINPVRETVARLSGDVAHISTTMDSVRRGIEVLTESLLRRDEAKR